ncbi:hypothetical protein Tco_0236069 [Tanacetum coccineum]
MKHISSRRSGGSIEGKVRGGGSSVGGNGGNGGSIAGRGGGSLAKCLMDSKGGLGGGGFVVLGGDLLENQRRLMIRWGELRTRVQQGLSLWLVVKSVWRVELVSVEERSKVMGLTLE